MIGYMLALQPVADLATSVVGSAAANGLLHCDAQLTRTISKYHDSATAASIVHLFIW
jgi:hypothetical protein